MGAFIRITFAVALVLAAAMHHRAGAQDSGDPLRLAVTALLEDRTDEADLEVLTETQRGDLLTILAAQNEATALRQILSGGLGADTLNSDGTTALRAAIFADSVEGAEALIEAGADPEIALDGIAADEQVVTLFSPRMQLLLLDDAMADLGRRLRLAAALNDTEEIGRLLEAGMDPDSAAPDGMTALLEAVMAGSVAAAGVLVDAGASLHKANDAGISPLAAATLGAQTEILEKMLKSPRASPNHKVDGVPLLSLAVLSGDQETIDLLIAHGADTDLEGSDTARPAALAAFVGDEDLSERLGGAPELKPPPDLMPLILNRDAPRVIAALERGADPNERAVDGTPAIIIAAAFSNDRVLNALASDERTDLFVTDAEGRNVFHAALSAKDSHATALNTIGRAVRSKSGESGLARLLRQPDASGRSALVRMSSRLRGSSSNYFWHRERILFGKLANEADPDGITPLKAAILSDNEVFAGIFTRQGVVPQSFPDGTSPQDLARSLGHWDVLGSLPDDRPIPVGFKKGVSIIVKKAMQRRLKEWGYYTGGIDGIFGAGSKAALERFLFDREGELRKMEAANPQISESRNNRNNIYELNYQPAGSWCRWIIIEWRAESYESDHFIGCVAGGAKWNADGFAYVSYKDSHSEITLLGPNGWNDEESLR